MSQVSHPKKRAMIEALHKSLGIVTEAANAVGINRKTHQRWCNEDTDYKAEVDDINNVSLDFVESQLFRKIKTGSVPCIIFYLKCKGKSRGYNEYPQLELSNIDPHTLTDEQLDRVIKGERIEKVLGMLPRR